MSRWRLIPFPELDSTNRYARLHLHQLAHADVVQAEVQTSGRGRFNRSWVSHTPGNLCLSLVIKPDVLDVSELPLANLSQLLALATCHALEASGVTAAIKWPNDIQAGGRKLAGILAETVTEGTVFTGLVLGIGVNLNLDRQTLESIDQPATAVNQQLRRAVDPAPFRDALLNEFFGQYDAFLNSGFPGIRDEFLQRCNFVGKQINVRRSSGDLTGTALDVNEQGALILKAPGGQLRAIEIGEIFAGA